MPGRPDAIALSSGQIDVAQAAFGGLTRTIELDNHIYPRPVRKRMAEIATGKWTVEQETQASLRAVVYTAVAAVMQAVAATKASAG